MGNTNKMVKRVIGGSLIVIAGVTGFYQYQFKKVESNDKVPVIVATKDIRISETLSADNVELVMRDKTTLSEGYVESIDDVNGAVAVNNIYKNESVESNRIVSEEEFKNKDLKLVSIKGTDSKKDTFVGYDVKPFDVVDVLYFDKSGVYEGQPYIEGQIIANLKSADGVSYTDRADGYIAAYALIWVPADKAEEISQRQEEGGYFKFQLHRERANKN